MKHLRQAVLLFALLCGLCLAVAPRAGHTDAAPIFNPANGHSYQAVIVPGGITWPNARNGAEALTYQGQRGYLATVTSDAENQFLTSNFGGPVADHWYLGGFQPPGSAEPFGGWQWVTGEAWNYTNWNSGEPNNSNSDDALAFWDNGRWNDANHGEQHGGYIVEYGTPTLPPPAPPPITFQSPALYPVDGAGDVSTFDFDDDGFLDIAVSPTNNMAILYGNGDGTFQQAVSLNTGINSAQTIKADLDQDGLGDLLFSANDGVYMMRNLDRRNYGPPVRLVSASRSFGVEAADFNEDGKLDIAYTDHEGHRLGVMLNLGGGVFSAPAKYPAGSFIGRVISGDWNYDGHVDLAVAALVSGTLSIFLGDGHGGFSGVATLRTGEYPNQVVQGDFNGDDVVDLATANIFGNSISVFFGNGNGSFRDGGTYGGDQYPHIMRASDLDQDGDPDLVTPNNGTTYFTVLRNTNGIFDAPLPYASGGSNTRTMAVGDFNRDGLPDVAVGNETSSTVAVHINTTQRLPPVPPNPISATALSSSSIQLRWRDRSANATGFLIEHSIDGGGTFSQIASLGAGVNTYTDSGLDADLTVFYRIRAVSPFGTGAYSPLVRGTTFPFPPAAPTDLVAVSNANSSFSLFWTDHATNEDGFKIERSDAGGPFTQIGTTGRNGDSFIDPGRSVGVTYAYRVRAYSRGGNSAYSNILTVSLPDPPTAPTDLTATATGQTTVDLTWTDTSSNEQGFQVLRSDNGGGSFHPVGTTGINEAAFTDTGLTKDTPYFYLVRAFNAGGNSPYSNLTRARTAGDPPAAPTNLVITRVANAAITLSWDDASNTEEGFKIERKIGGGAFELLATVGQNAGVYTDDGLSPSQTYTYRVRAFNRGGASAFSNEVSATLPSLPAAPSGLQSTVLGSTSVRLTWVDNSDNESGFRIERSGNGGASYTVVGTVVANETTFTDSGLTADTPYIYTVRAFNASGVSGYADPVAARTRP
jgi:hypothetical protein